MKTGFFHFLSLWRMFAPLDITIGAYGSIFNHFQTSNQKSVLKNKWLSNFQKTKTKSLPTYPYVFFMLRQSNQFLLGLTPVYFWLFIAKRPFYQHSFHSLYWHDLKTYNLY